MKKDERITLTDEQMKELKETGETTVEIEDVDFGLTEKDVDTAAKIAEKKVKASHVLNKDQQRLYKKIMEAAGMPTKLKDSEFKMGKNELDIRSLSVANRSQMLFRSLVVGNVSLRDIGTTLIDISRLLMIICDKLGIEDIVGATDDVIEKVEKQRKIKKQLKEQVKANKKNDAAKA